MRRRSVHVKRVFMASTTVLPHVVPGAYLVRAGSLSVDELRAALAPFGLLFVRRFLAHAVRSDYLTLFDPKILVNHCQVESTVVRARTPGITPPGSWAALTQKETTVKLPVVVVEARSGNAPCPPVSDGSKKARPGRRVRQMIKALKKATAPPTEETPVLPPPSPSEAEAEIPPSPKEVKAPPPSPTEAPRAAETAPKSIPLGATLLLRAGELTFQLRPFRVSDQMEADRVPLGGQTNLITVPHLTIYHPPRPEVTTTVGRAFDTRVLEHVWRCHAWMKRVLSSLVTCGILQDESECSVQLAQMDASRLARPNLVALQCRFSDSVSQAVRNSVFAILRSSIWFSSLADDAHSAGTPYLVRCWWRQVPPVSEI